MPREVRTPVNRKLAAAVAVGAFILVAGAVSVMTLVRLIGATAEVDRTDRVLQDLQDVIANLRDGETGQRGYLLTGDSTYLAPYRAAHSRADSALARLRASADSVPGWQDRLRMLDSLVDAKFTELDRSLAAYERQGSSAANAIVRSGYGLQLMVRARDSVAVLRASARAERKEQIDARRKATRMALAAVALATVLGFLFTLVINGALRTELARQVERDTMQRERAAAEQLLTQAGADRVGLLANASKILGSSLDYETTLRHVANMVIPSLADWSSVEIVDPDGQTRQLVVAHADPAKVEAVRLLTERYPPDKNAATGVPAVIRSGKSEFYPTIPQALLEAGAVDEAHLEMIKAIGIRSAIIVPIQGREQILGAISLVTAESGREYTGLDLTLAEELGRRAAAAIENARSFEEAQSARDQANAANEAKSAFLATMSHEIRTPINAVMGYADLLEMRIGGPLTDDQAAHVDRIRRSSGHLLGLVNELLDVSKVESGTLTVQREPALAREDVEAAVTLLRPMAVARQIELSIESTDDAVAYIGDASRVRQIITNLLANAVKFTEPGGSVGIDVKGGVTPPAPSTVTPGGSYVEIRVADTGVGIAPKEQARVFEAFMQVNQGYSRPHGGTGLGLTISRQLARLMGGDITVESTLGKGSAFSLWLPAA